MKLIIGVIAVFTVLQVQAQDKQPVYSIVKVVEELSWYETQAGLWKKEIDNDKTNAEAWYNYYMAYRGLKYVSEKEGDKEKYKTKCAEITKACYAAIPNSFVGNHLMYRDTGISNINVKYLLKASEIAPDDPRNFDDLLIYYQINFDYENAEIVAKKMFEVNELSSNLMNWGYNVLAELDEGAIVFTAGDNDTYALWIVQQALGFRKDVTVVNTYVAQLDDYRKRLTDRLGLAEFKFDGNVKNLMNHLLVNSKDIPAYISMSAIRQFQEEGIEDDLYLNGLTYKYSKTDFDNSGVIRRNYEKRYLVDYLELTFGYEEHYRETAIHMNAMYLASMVKLYKIYKVGEENDKAAELHKLITEIAKASGQYEEVEKILKDC